MTSSTSQSVFSEARGMITSSFGPTMQDGALLKRIGSGGIGAPVSLAWSTKLRPTAMKLPGRATQGPRRAPGGAAGSVAGSTPFSRSRLWRERAAPFTSGITPERSRIRPSLSTRPGFSCPLGPKRTSFMRVPPGRGLLGRPCFGPRFGRRQALWSTSPSGRVARLLRFCYAVAELSQRRSPEPIASGSEYFRLFRRECEFADASKQSFSQLARYS